MAKSDNPIYPWVTTGTGEPTITSTSSSTASRSIRIAFPSNFRPEKSLTDIENAVFAHIQAVRALGRNQINSEEIAQALSIPQSSVIAAIARLQGKGVRVIG